MLPAVRLCLKDFLRKERLSRKEQLSRKERLSPMARLSRTEQLSPWKDHLCLPRTFSETVRALIILNPLRRLIINADDFGLTESVSAGILTTMAKGPRTFSETVRALIILNPLRRLIINADDFGLTESVSAGIL